MYKFGYVKKILLHDNLALQAPNRLYFFVNPRQDIDVLIILFSKFTPGVKILADSMNASVYIIMFFTFMCAKNHIPIHIMMFIL